jgi:hypothetical protein
LRDGLSSHWSGPQSEKKKGEEKKKEHWKLWFFPGQGDVGWRRPGIIKEGPEMRS